jgi:uncharacterized protein (TIRG00374 family)
MAAQPMTNRWIGRIIVSTAAAAAVYLAIALWAGRLQVISALRLVGVGTIAAVLTLSLLNYALRFLRWHFYLGTLGGNVPPLHDLRIYIGGFSLTTTPGKAGEMARSLWLQPYGVPTATSLAAFLAERFQDFLVVVILSGVGASLYHDARWLLGVSLGVVMLMGVFLAVPSISQTALGSLAARQGRFAAVARGLLGIFALTSRCLTPERFGVGFLFGLGAWCAEGLGFFLIMRALEYPLHLFDAIAIYALSMLAGAISFLPGGLGGSEAAMILLLRASSVPLAIAVSATLMIRIATLWFAVLLGFVALAFRVGKPDQKSDASTASPLPDSA